MILVALAACLPGVGCGGPPLEPLNPAVRLGQQGPHETDGSATLRPTLPGSGEHRIDLDSRSAGTLVVAARQHPQQNAPCTCHAVVVSDAHEPVARASFDLGHAHQWREATLDIPAGTGPASLQLACDPPGAARWARPILLPRPEEGRKPPLVVLLSLDTLRADHVEGFGAPAGSTPALAAIGDEGLRMTEAASEYTWTLPSHFSLFHSRLFGFPSSAGTSRPLAELLAEAGFVTGAFTGGGFVGHVYRTHHGFDLFREYNATARGVRELDLLPEALADAQAWVEHRADAPTLAFVHTYAVHQTLPGEAESRPLVGRRLTLPAPDDIRRARELYARLVGELDAALAPFLAWLREKSRERPTFLVVFSDHGEAFGEHANYRHGMHRPLITLHDELVHVPVLFWAPGIIPAGRTRTEAWGLLDIAPTILGAAGLAVPPDMQGRNLYPEVVGSWRQYLPRRAARRTRPAISYLAGKKSFAAQWSARTPGSKLIVPTHPDPTPANSELYDLAVDPGETRNISATGDFRPGLQTLRETLRDLGVSAADPGAPLPTCPQCDFRSASDFLNSVQPATRPREPGEPADPASERLPPEARERLRSLGYLR